MAGIIAALLLCLPSSARADWIAGVFLGQQWTRPGTVTLALPDRQTTLDVDGVTYRGESFASPQYYGARIMWVPDARPWLGVEVEFIHAKVYAQTNRVAHIRGTLRGAAVDASIPLSSIVQRLAMSHGLNFLLANVALRRGFGPVDGRGAPRLVAAVRAGAGPTMPHAESTIDDLSREQFESGGLGAQATAGLEMVVWRGVGVLAEYKFTWATPVIDVAGGEATIPSRSHHLIGGVSYRF